ncbi:PA polymerase subunit [Thogotovirus thogotoense]|uniref:Polymerase acidic protein n=1 Tax=Thogoto virus (isolate SiAr 126) TaxID=126796 RepID=PA_THOGV|nr:PA polymerase subunit [Thogotovirus thogotoense]P27194.2 RecName: Full=Polymerase acidic protein; Short=PA; AltName: Full=RNA-directed RNA polymerase subunit P3 [Thogoto virus (isolate SiAr 126)]AAB62893.1 PA polymerase subunit [Thogotovirus thogotoense]
MTDRPDHIDSRVWELSETQEDWITQVHGHVRRVVECWKYTICCLISNMHTHRGAPQYDVFKWQDRSTIEWICSKKKVQYPERDTPDLYDNERAVAYKVLLVSDLSDHSPTSGIYHDLAFNLEGEAEESCALVLRGSQLQDIKGFLCRALEWVVSNNLTQEVVETISGEAKLQFSVGTTFRTLLKRDTDWDVIPTPRVEPNVPRIEGRRWTQMKKLPLLKEKEGPPSPWRALLLGADSEYIVCPPGTDQEAISWIHSQSEIECIRESKSTPASVITCLTSSLQSFAEGNPVRSRIHEDIIAFGINKKQEKKQSASSSASGEWKRAEYQVEEMSLPPWVEEEMVLLRSDQEDNWIELEKNAIYTEVDGVAEGLVDKYIEIVGRTKVASVIEKWQIAATRTFSQLHTDRSRITACPIITRDPSGNCQFWGMVLLGPHHVKRDTDNAPLLIAEIMGEDTEEKYPKHSVFSLKVEGKQFLLSLKITSFSRNKLYTFSNIRRVLIQPASIYSQVVLSRAAENNSLNLEVNPEIQLYLEGAQRGMTLYQWVRMILCLEFLMAIYNNPQMEGFLANMRRLHMSRHAMMERRQVFLPFGSRPEDKVNECIINNPIVAYLAKGWNSMPNVYY